MFRKENSENRLWHTILPIGMMDAPADQGAGGGKSTPVAQQIEKTIEDQLAVNYEIPPPPPEKTDSPLPPEKKDTPPPPKNDALPPPVKTDAPPPAKVDTPTGYKPSKYWEKVKTGFEEANGTDSFKLPDGITEENEHEKLFEFLQENYIGNPELFISQLDPRVQNIVRSSLEENFDYDTHVAQANNQNAIFNLPSDQFMKVFLKQQNGKSEKNPDGWTDEDINVHVEKMDKIERDKQVLTLKNQMKVAKQQELSEKNKVKESENEKNFQKILSKQETDISTLIERNKSKKTFMGIEFSDAEKEQFLKDLPSLIKINPKTKTFPLYDMLRSDDTLMEMAAVVWKGEKGVRDHIDEIRENGIQNVWSKLRLNSINESGSIIDKHQPNIPGDEAFV